MENVNPSDIVEVVQKYKNFVKTLCKRYYIIGGTADDLFEEGIIGILEACKNYSGKSFDEDAFDPFVKMCIKRQLIDAVKKANTQKSKVLNESLPLVVKDENGEEKSFLDSFTDRNNPDDPLELVIDKEKYNEKVKACEIHLSEFEKEVFRRYLQGEKQSEIADSLKKDVKSIDNTLQRIKCKLK